MHQTELGLGKIQDAQRPITPAENGRLQSHSYLYLQINNNGKAIKYYKRSQAQDMKRTRIIPSSGVVLQICDLRVYDLYKN